MSLTQDVRMLLEARGDRGATVDDLLPELPGHTRTQVINSLQWLRSTGVLVSTPRKGPARSGSLPAIYRPKPRPLIRCVWDLASPLCGCSQEYQEVM